MLLLAAGSFDVAASEAPAGHASARPDTTYGRIDGDVAIVAGVGATFGPNAARGALDLRVRYIETAGLFFTYEEGKVFGDGAEPVRVLAGGLELRPLFLGRWLTGHELGVGRVDLAIDSFGLEIGGFFAQPQGASFGERPGLQIGLGLELPILAAASGPWIGFHGGMRWSDAALGGATPVDAADRALFLSITLAWHQVLGVHFVDFGDRAPR